MAGSAKINVEFAASIKEVKAALKEVSNAVKQQNQASKQQSKQSVKDHGIRKKQIKELNLIQKKAASDREKEHRKITLDNHRREMKLYRDQYREKKRMDTAYAKERAKVDRGGNINQKGGRIAGSVMRAAAGVASGLAGFFVGAVTGAYAKRNEYQQSLGPSIGLGKGSRVKAGITGARGAKLGFSNIESAQMNPMMARATGALGPRELQQGMRATGMEAGTVAGIYGGLARAGTSFKGGEFRGESKGGREFAKMISAGMQSGLEKGRLPEFAEGVMSIVEQRGSSASGDVSPGNITNLMTALGKSGLSGFRGARGADVAGKLHQAFTNTGGGEWGDNFMRMAMGFGKPGGGSGFFDAEKQREKGIDDPTNVDKLLGEIARQFGTGKEGALATRELTGFSLQQSEDLLKMREDGSFSKERLSEISKAIDSAKPIADQSLEAMKGIGGTLSRLAGRTNTLIGIGERIAPDIEKIEDWQFELIKALMGIKDTLTNFYQEASVFFKTSAPEETRQALKDLDAKRGAETSKLTPEQRAEHARETINQRGQLGAKHAAALEADRIKNDNPLWKDILTGGGKLVGPLGKLIGLDNPNTNSTIGADKTEILLANKQQAELDASYSAIDYLGDRSVPPELRPAINEHITNAAKTTARKRAEGTAVLGDTPNTDSLDAGALAAMLRNIEFTLSGPDAREPKVRGNSRKNSVK